jgi:hypothetical protein
MLFFEAKHRPGLTDFAPFCEDPYDSVGSFAFQLAGAAGAISMLRALRGYGAGRIPDAQALLILRGAVVALLAILVTAISDIVAMARQRDVWISSPAGQGLAVCVGIAALVTSGFLGWVWRVVRRLEPAVRPHPWRRASGIAFAGALILWLYPPEWRHGVTGAILTAVAGMVLLFVEVWALAVVLLPRRLDRSEDLLDDARYFLERLAQRIDGRTGLFIRSLVQPAIRWLRARPWACVGAVALAGGLGLSAVEALGEGLPETLSKTLLLLGVTIGIEAAGITLGYALFCRLIALRRVEEDRGCLR